MIGKFKVLGLALVTATALSAIAASAAQAGSLDIGKNPAVVTGHTEPVQSLSFNLQKTGGGTQLKASCQTASFEGTVTQEGSQTQQNVTDATLTPTFGTGHKASDPQGCVVVGQKSQVIMNGCKFTLTGSGHAANTATLDIVGCTAGKQIEVRNAACTLKVGEQNGLSHVVGAQVSSHEVTLQATVTGITAQQSGGALCPDGAAPHTGPNASFSGNLTVKAYEDLGSEQVTTHEHQYNRLIEGTTTTIAST